MSMLVGGVLIGGATALVLGGEDESEPRSSTASPTGRDTTATTVTTIPTETTSVPATTVTTIPSKPPPLPPVPSSLPGLPTCSDPLNSASWPPPTFGPVVAFPCSPLGVPPLAERQLTGPYVAVVQSFGLDRVADVERLYNSLTAAGVNVAFADSRKYAGFRDPYFVLLIDGFASPADVRRFKLSSSLPSNLVVYPRNPFDPSDPAR